MKNTAIATALGIVLSAGIASADNVYQTLPFSQDWTNIGLITTNDDWSGVPGVLGYLGDGDAGSLTAVSPCTTSTTADITTAVDVIANQTLTTISNGGVAEFHITNPVVAIQGSGTADWPNLQIHLNTTGYQSITVAAQLRDIDGGNTDNAVQPIALQYRVGTTGTWTCVNTVADATTGPNLATLVTPVNVVLPGAADNQAQVQIRFLTTNAVGNDEWVGIDDITVTGTLLPVPTVSTTWGAIKTRNQ